jgi:hypothetical protein
LATSKLDKKLTPVTFPPGQLKLATSPNYAAMKAKIALEALREQATVADLAQRGDGLLAALVAISHRNNVAYTHTRCVYCNAE